MLVLFCRPKLCREVAAVALKETKVRVKTDLSRVGWLARQERARQLPGRPGEVVESPGRIDHPVATRGVGERESHPVSAPADRTHALPPGQAWRLAVLIPAYNEERFIGSVVLKARRYTDQVLVVDDGSTDATAAIAEAAGAQVLRHAQNRGKGAALNTGFQAARGLGATLVVTIDADGQHLVEEISTVVAPILAGEADLVVGSRYLEPRSTVPPVRIFGHQLVNVATTHLSGVALTDSQSGFRAFSARALRSLSFQSHGFSVESEMQFLARDHRLRTVEVPITILYPDRPKRGVVRHGLLVLNGLLQLVGQYRPLLFFGLAGLILLVAGLGWGLWIVEIYVETHRLAIGYALISVLLSVVGTITLFSGLILHSVRGLLLGVGQRGDLE